MILIGNFFLLGLSLRSLPLQILPCVPLVVQHKQSAEVTRRDLSYSHWTAPAQRCKLPTSRLAAGMLSPIRYYQYLHTPCHIHPPPLKLPSWPKHPRTLLFTPCRMPQTRTPGSTWAWAHVYVRAHAHMHPSTAQSSSRMFTRNVGTILSCTRATAYPCRDLMEHTCTAHISAAPFKTQHCKTGATPLTGLIGHTLIGPSYGTGVRWTAQPWEASEATGLNMTLLYSPPLSSDLRPQQT